MNAVSIDVSANDGLMVPVPELPAASPGGDALPAFGPWRFVRALRGHITRRATVCLRISVSSSSLLEAAIPFFVNNACVRRDVDSATAATSGSSGARKDRSAEILFPTRRHVTKNRRG